jgi:hypothetical protein
MRELRRLKRVRDELGLQLLSEWIPSVANKFNDALSRRFSPGDLAVSQTLRRSVVDGMMAPLAPFPLRPLGKNPVFLRRQCLNELASHWSREEPRLLCPPVELMAAVVRKLRISKASALLLMSDRPRQAWYQPAMDMSTKMLRLPPSPNKSLDSDSNTTTESILASPAPRSEPASRHLPVPSDPTLTRFPSDGHDTRRRRHPSHLIWANAVE